MRSRRFAVGTALVTSILAAYGLAFRQWRGRRGVFWFVIATMAVPTESVDPSMLLAGVTLV